MLQRVRVRFRKEGDLRWIGHRDLMRAVERLCRRANLKLRRGAGFHPKPKVHFPSALALGIEGRDEVMEWELTEPITPPCLLERLQQCAPRGLVITSVEEVPAGRAKARVRVRHYQFPVPDELRQHVRQAEANRSDVSRPPQCSPDRPMPVDVLAQLTNLELRDGMLCFGIPASPQATVRPRDVLQALGLADLVQRGFFLTRSQVELVS